jgi:hypothetical protein
VECMPCREDAIAGSNFHAPPFRKQAQNRGSGFGGRGSRDQIRAPEQARRRRRARRRRPADELAGGAPPGAERVPAPAGRGRDCAGTTATSARGRGGGGIDRGVRGGRARSCSGDRRRDARTAGGATSGRRRRGRGIPPTIHPRAGRLVTFTPTRTRRACPPPPPPPQGDRIPPQRGGRCRWSEIAYLGGDAALRADNQEERAIPTRKWFYSTGITACRSAP